ncbi:hypothetical protein CEXT_473651 [Caerostris extrusa]|uniref:Uncharacterized protein n=1 Tax=Caerostris extrusa TaxID=172846 RepID=A0AAV4RLD3_CAEEX|nr:hypothetical protein CEXT_473651 [Caerostris extrusa]
MASQVDSRDKRKGGGVLVEGRGVECQEVNGLNHRRAKVLNFNNGRGPGPGFMAGETLISPDVSNAHKAALAQNVLPPHGMWRQNEIYNNEECAAVIINGGYENLDSFGGGT